MAQISVRADDSVTDALKEAAREEGRSVTLQATRIITAWLIENNYLLKPEARIPRGWTEGSAEAKNAKALDQIKLEGARAKTKARAAAPAAKAPPRAAAKRKGAK